MATFADVRSSLKSLGFALCNSYGFSASSWPFHMDDLEVGLLLNPPRHPGFWPWLKRALLSCLDLVGWHQRPFWALVRIWHSYGGSWLELIYPRPEQHQAMSDLGWWLHRRFPHWKVVIRHDESLPLREQMPMNAWWAP